MKAEKTETKSEILNRLFKENGLIEEDYFKHSQYTILTRSGIEKVQYKNKVTVRFEPVTMTPSFCVVKAQATKPIADDKCIEVQTFGSAGFNADGNFPKNKGNQYLYFPEMAEKRALSRAVLKICNFYELGVYGEDEADFKAKEEVDGLPKEVTTQVLLLLSNSAFSVEERKKGELALKDYNLEEAKEAIEKLKKVIQKRTPEPIETTLAREKSNQAA